MSRTFKDMPLFPRAKWENLRLSAPAFSGCRQCGLLPRERVREKCKNPDCKVSHLFFSPDLHPKYYTNFRNKRKDERIFYTAPERRADKESSRRIKMEYNDGGEVISGEIPLRRNKSGVFGGGYLD